MKITKRQLRRIIKEEIAGHNPQEFMDRITSIDNELGELYTGMPFRSAGVRMAVEKVKEAMRKISKHFDLDRTRQNIREYLDDSLMSFTQFFTDSDKKQYFITINNKHIKISDASFVIWEKNIKEKHK